MSQALYDLPEWWEWVFVKDLIRDIASGAACNKSHEVDDGIVHLRTHNIDANGKLNFDLIIKINPDQLDKKKFGLLKGDIVFNNTNSQELVGKTAYIDADYTEYAFSNHLTRLRLNDKAIPKFLVYWFGSLQRSGYFSLICKKWIGQAGINTSVLKELSVPLPPIAEQTRIVEKLDAVLSRIDTAIDELQQSLALVDAMFKSGLDGVFADLALLYNVTALSQVVKINSGIALPSIFKESHASGAIPFYKVAQMNNHPEIMTGSEILFSSEISKTHKVTIFPKGSVLIPKRGGAILTNKKRILVEDASYDSNIMGLKANNQLISDEYLFAFMQSIDLSDFVDASTIPQINNKHIDQMMIPVPSLSEQEKAVQHINELTNYTTQLKTELTAKIGMFNQLKASVLDGAFRGEV